MKKNFRARGTQLGAVVGVSLACIAAGSAFACDLCAVYSSIQAEHPSAGSFRMGLTEQFTAYDTIQDGGRKIANPAHQHLESSITQLLGIYEAADRLQLQAALPYINRRYKRFDGATETGTEAGIGDLTLIARGFPVRYSDGRRSLVVHGFLGVKLPTGDSDRLKEEQTEHAADDAAIARHGGAHDDDEPASAVHGHDLALGSGSIDFPIGAGLFAQLDRAFFSTDVQYAFRTEGRHDYRYANDLVWSAGPGAYLVLNDATQMALRASLSGEYKRNDRGQDDTAVNSLFLGPELSATIESRLAANAAVDFPLEIQNSSVQAVPGYRIRAGLTYRF